MILQAAPGVLSRGALPGLLSWYRAGAPTFLTLWQQVVPQDHPSLKMREGLLTSVVLCPRPRQTRRWRPGTLGQYLLSRQPSFQGRECDDCFSMSPVVTSQQGPVSERMLQGRALACLVTGVPESSGNTGSDGVGGQDQPSPVAPAGTAQNPPSPAPWFCPCSLEPGEGLCF